MLRGCANGARSLSGTSTLRVPSPSQLVLAPSTPRYRAVRSCEAARCWAFSTKENSGGGKVKRNDSLASSVGKSRSQRSAPIRSNRLRQNRQAKNQISGKRDPSQLNSAQSRPSEPPAYVWPITTEEAGQNIAALQLRLAQLEPLPPVWDTPALEISTADAEERSAIFQEAQTLVLRLKANVENDRMSPVGTHGRELAHLLGQILTTYAKTPTLNRDRDPVVFNSCCEVMTLLQEWNFSFLPFHYACTIEAAARESRWKEGAYFFSEQINPETSGHTPVEDVVLGLYVIARSTQLEGGSAADHVMDAVLRLSMVSPTTQDQYVLSAGVALGHIGEGEGFVSYLENSFNSSRFGQPLVAAVMHACILSSRPDEALRLFGDAVLDPALGSGGGAWQRKGEYHAMHPVCRDLAMRALGASAEANLSDFALELYQQVKTEEMQISVDALAGIVKTCERDGKWKEAVDILVQFIDRCRVPRSLLEGDVVMTIGFLEERADSDAKRASVDLTRRSLPQVRDMLSSVMRACNASGNFGMALISCHIVDDALFPPASATDVLDRSRDDLAAFLVQTGFRLGTSEDFLLAAMASLCGLGCHRHAENLYHALTSDSHVNEWYDARDFIQCIRSTLARQVISLPGPWEAAHRHICLLGAACTIAEWGESELTDRQRVDLASGLCKAMRACTAAGQAEAGIFFAQRIRRILAPADNTGGFSIRNALAFFFGYRNAQSGSDALLDNSAVLAETIKAYREMNLPKEALDLISMIPESFGVSTRDDAKWTPVVNEAITLLAAEKRIDDAKTLFRTTNDSIRNQETVLAMATGFASDDKWREVIKIYYRASQDGLLSEGVGVLAMKAVVELHADERAQSLRSISKEISALAGMPQKEWLESRYWQLERALGWNPTRLLMWWSDPATAKEMKLQFAIEQFFARQNAGLSPKNDALRFIVSSIHEFDSARPGAPFNSEEEWLGFLRILLIEAESSTLWNNPKFIENACRSLLWVAGRKECVELATGAVARGVQITGATVMEATGAAEAENLDVEELSMLLARPSTTIMDTA